jgi:hypothetical protein
VRSGRRDEGLPLVERSVRLAPANTLYRQNLGLLLAEAGEPAAAAAQFQDIWCSSPASHRAQLSRDGTPASSAA